MTGPLGVVGRMSVTVQPGLLSSIWNLAQAGVVDQMLYQRVIYLLPYTQHSNGTGVPVSRV